MFVVEVDLRVRPGAGQAFTDDQITDLIEALVDRLDDSPAADPSVGTKRVGDEVEVTIGVVIDDSDRFEALRRGVQIVSSVLRERLGGPGLMLPEDEDLRAKVRTLEAA